MAGMRHVLTVLVLVLAVSGCGDQPDDADPTVQPQLETTDTAAPYPHVPTAEATPPESQSASPAPARRYASAFAVGEDLEICETWFPQDDIGGIETVGCDDEGESIRVTWFADNAERTRYEQAVKAFAGGTRAVLLGDEYGVVCGPPARCKQLEKQRLGRLVD